MGKFLEKMNKGLEEKYGLDATVDIASSDIEQNVSILEKYKQYLDEKKIFKVSFVGCDRGGNFSYREGGYVVIMPGDDTKEKLPYFKPHIASKLLGYEFDVRVTSIDEEQKRIYVEGAKRTGDAKGRMISEICKEVAKKNYPIVWGKIIKVMPDKAYVDILGLGIFGIVDSRHWKQAYTRNLETCCSQDDFFQFKITHANRKIRGKQQTFLLDRRDIAGNPWNDVPVDLVREGAVVYVKCTELPKEKSYWWGSLELTPGIEVMGDYPSSSLAVVPDLTYKCKVKAVNITGESRGNTLKVVPFEIAEADKARYTKYLKELKPVK